MIDTAARKTYRRHSRRQHVAALYARHTAVRSGLTEQITDMYLHDSVLDGWGLYLYVGVHDWGIVRRWRTGPGWYWEANPAGGWRSSAFVPAPSAEVALERVLEKLGTRARLLSPGGVK